MLVSASVPVLVITTRHRAIGWLSGALGVQSAAFVGSQEDWLDNVQIWSRAEMAAPGGGVSGCTVAVAAELGEATNGPVGGSPLAHAVWVTVIGGATLLSWHSNGTVAPAAKVLATVPPQSLCEGGSEVITSTLVSGSVPVLVTMTRHHTSVPYTVADEAQSLPLIGCVGSQEDPTGKVHTCTTAVRDAIGSVVPDEIVTLALDVEEVTSGPVGGVPVALAVLVVGAVTPSL